MVLDNFQFEEQAMKEFLDKIRTPQKTYPIPKQLLISVSILLLGAVMGTFSKYLDYQQANLPALLHLIDSAVDLHNFLGKLAPWIVIAVCIAVYSTTPIRAGINVFAFFAGMVSSYYLYSNFIAGFFPKSYALVWIVFTAVSPFLAFLCWYAKGTGWIALLLSSVVTGVLLNCAFGYGAFYIDVSSGLELLMLTIGVFVLRRPLKETAGMIGLGIIFAIIMQAVIPFRVW